MEDVLEVYQRPHDPERPVVCLDETSKQLIAETRAPIAATPGHAARYDYEYERNGMANLFMIFAPLEGRRRRQGNGAAHGDRLRPCAQACGRQDFPGAEKIVLVQDNLNTHKPASLYEAFPAAGSAPPDRTIRMALHAEARKLARHGRIRTQPSSRRNVSTGVSAIWPPCSTKSPPGIAAATSIKPKPTGSSQPTMPASNSQGYTLSSSDFRLLGACLSSH